MEQRTAVTSHGAALAVDTRLESGRILQELLIDVLELSLQGKQAHWNLRGRMFRELHLLLDELVDDARTHSEELAERCLALGLAADGRTGTIARGTHLDAFPEGRVEDHEVVELMVRRLHTVSEVGRSQLGRLGKLDPVSQDRVNEVLGGLEKHLWMFEAHRPAETTG